MLKVNDPTLTASSASRMFRYSKSIFCLFELFCSLLTLSRNSLIRAKVGKFALSSVPETILPSPAKMPTSSSTSPFPETAGVAVYPTNRTPSALRTRCKNRSRSCFCFGTLAASKLCTASIKMILRSHGLSPHAPNFSMGRTDGARPDA